MSFATAVLGGTVDVPTLDGNVLLKVPPETQSGSVFRLRGKGVRSVRASGLGDLFCRVQVETPVKLTSDQKDKLRAFDDSIQNEASRHNPRARSWFDGVKAVLRADGSLTLLKVAVLGAAGRMGRAVLSCIAEADDLEAHGRGHGAERPVARPRRGRAARRRRARRAADGRSRVRGCTAPRWPIDFTLPSAHGGQSARVCRERLGARDRHDGSRRAADEGDGAGGARDSRRLRPQHERRRQRVHGTRRARSEGARGRRTTSRSRKRTTGTRSTRRRAPRSRSARESRPRAAGGSESSRSMRATAVSGRACPARSASRSFAAATWSASTRCVSSARKRKSRSSTRPRTARRSRAARCAPRVGPRAGRPGSIRWSTCSGSRATEKNFRSPRRTVDRRRTAGLELPPEFPRST